MATTTNFGWETPDDTDLVKDGALAMRTLGNAIDTSLVDLKGGTTGQNLRKNSNTDMDFVWAGDATNTVIDAEGDLLVGDAADTLQRLAIGTTGQVLTVDTTLDGKIKWAAASSSGLTLIKTQTIGSAVSSVTVTDAFNADYENYYITLNGGSGSTSNRLTMVLGASATSYYATGTSIAYPTAGSTATRRDDNAVAWNYAGTYSANGNVAEITLLNPYLAKSTVIFNKFVYADGAEGAGYMNGVHTVSTSYTAFTLTTQSGSTMTGGEIRVYGLRKTV